MIQFKPEYVKTRIPGYYWNTRTLELYSCKSGVLKPLKKNKGFTGYCSVGYVDIGEHYRVSHKGVSKTFTMKYLLSLKPTETINLFPEFKNEQN